MALAMLALPLACAPIGRAAWQSDPQATPAPATSSFVCNSRPASAAGLVAVLRQPTVEDPVPADARGDVVPPNERAAVDHLVGRWAVCLAAGDVRGLLGLFTADGVRRLFAERAPFIGGPAGMRISVLGGGDVIRLPDGRLAARVPVDPSGSGTAQPEALLVILEQGADGIWRIDHLTSPRAAVGAAGQTALDPQAGTRPLLRSPISPGPNVPIPAPGPSVPMRGGDAARSGNQPGPTPGTEPVERWRAPVGWRSVAQPVVARGLVYVGGFSLGDRTPLLEALDAATGGVRWQTTAPVAWAEFPDSPALAGDTLFAPVQAPIAGVLAVAAGNGQALWYAPFGFLSVTAPAVDADSVYVAGWGARNARDRAQNDISGVAFALDQRNGRERWRFLASARFGAVAVGRSSIFVPSDHGLYALDRATGRKRWQARFSPGPDDTATIVGETVAFIGSDITNGKAGIFALDAASGALRWRADLPTGATMPAGIAATGDTLYATWWEAQASGSVPTMRAYDLASGRERWVFHGETDESGGEVGLATAPVIVADTVLFGSAVDQSAENAASNRNGLYAVDAASGTLRWHGAATTTIGSAPAALDGVIYAMGSALPDGSAASGTLLAFSAE